MRILVAEDETDIRNLIKEQLEEEGYEVLTAADGLTAKEIAKTQEIDLFLLDIMMPGLDGISLLHTIRTTSQTPVILITARGEEYDKMMGFHMGADDYIVKPFSLQELSARVAVQIRHMQRSKPEQIMGIGDLVIDLVGCRVKKQGQELSLNAKEFMILKYLLQHKNQVVTKQQIYEAVWGEDYLFDDNTIMVQISHLRGKIEDANHKYIQTMKGIGYRFREE